MNQPKLFIFKNKLINRYSLAQLWHQQLFLWIHEEHCSFVKERNFLTEKKIYGRWIMYFKNPKFISRPDFWRQYIRVNCAPKIVQSKLVLVSNCRGPEIRCTWKDSLKTFEQNDAAVYLHVILCTLLYLQCMKNI